MIHILNVHHDKCNCHVSRHKGISAREQMKGKMTTSLWGSPTSAYSRATLNHAKNRFLGPSLKDFCLVGQEWVFGIWIYTEHPGNPTAGRLQTKCWEVTDGHERAPTKQPTPHDSTVRHTLMWTDSFKNSFLYLFDSMFY